MKDFKAMPYGLQHAFWYCVGRVKHCPLWCSWCRVWGPWEPEAGRIDCHREFKEYSPRGIAIALALVALSLGGVLVALLP